MIIWYWNNQKSKPKYQKGNFLQKRKPQQKPTVQATIQVLRRKKKPLKKDEKLPKYEVQHLTHIKKDLKEPKLNLFFIYETVTIKHHQSNINKPTINSNQKKVSE